MSVRRLSWLTTYGLQEAHTSCEYFGFLFTTYCFPHADGDRISVLTGINILMMILIRIQVCTFATALLRPTMQPFPNDILVLGSDIRLLPRECRQHRHQPVRRSMFPAEACSLDGL